MAKRPSTKRPTGCRLPSPFREWAEQRLDNIIKDGNRAVILRRVDLLELRWALNEAIESVLCMADSNLPPHKKDYTPSDHRLARGWQLRIKRWKKLRKKLGGELPGELTAYEEYQEVRAKEPE